MSHSIEQFQLSAECRSEWLKVILYRGTSPQDPFKRERLGKFGPLNANRGAQERRRVATCLTQELVPQYPIWEQPANSPICMSHPLQSRVEQYMAPTTATSEVTDLTSKSSLEISHNEPLERSSETPQGLLEQLKQKTKWVENPQL
jgi:hypothetical protein